jgi:hypothetical protein
MPDPEPPEPTPEPQPPTPEPTPPQPQIQADAPEPSAAQPSAAQPATPEPARPTADDPPAGGAPVGETAATGPAAGAPPSTEPAAAPSSHPDLTQVQRIWPAVLDKLAEKAPALAATFEGARPVAFDDEGLTIGFPPDQPFNKRKAESPDRRQALIDAFTAVTGETVGPRYAMLAEGDAPAGPAPPDTPVPGGEGIDEDELLDRLMSEFDAKEVN